MPTLSIQNHDNKIQKMYIATCDFNKPKFSAMALKGSLHQHTKMLKYVYNSSADQNPLTFIKLLHEIKEIRNTNRNISS
jgi:hypothetical protein